MAFGELIEHAAHFGSVVSACLQLALELQTRVLAARQRRERIGLGSGAILPTQASASDSLSAGILWGKAVSRILVSSSFARSG